MGKEIDAEAADGCGFAINGWGVALATVVRDGGGAGTAAEAADGCSFALGACGKGLGTVAGDGEGEARDAVVADGCGLAMDAWGGALGIETADVGGIALAVEAGDGSGNNVAVRTVSRACVVGAAATGGDTGGNSERRLASWLLTDGGATITVDDRITSSVRARFIVLVLGVAATGGGTGGNSER